MDNVGFLFLLPGPEPKFFLTDTNCVHRQQHFDLKNKQTWILIYVVLQAAVLHGQDDFQKNVFHCLNTCTEIKNIIECAVCHSVIPDTTTRLQQGTE